jgi:hypothetical protein
MKKPFNWKRHAWNLKKERKAKKRAVYLHKRDAIRSGGIALFRDCLVENEDKTIWCPNRAFIHNGAHWALRKRDLPFRRQNSMDYSVNVWQGAHPSPAFKGISVWFVRRVNPDMTLASLFKKVYGGHIKDLLPMENSMFKQRADR